MNLKIFTNTIDAKAVQQIDTLMNQPAFCNCKVRIMPDVHAGVGCVIGFTADLGDKVIPNIVGVDIGCGMLTVPLGNREIDFQKLDTFIYHNIPHGKAVHSKNDEMQYDEMESLICYEELSNKKHLHQSLGTLGGGNHFIEIDKDDSDNKYLVIHSGSRNLGKQVADLYQKKAISKHGANYSQDVSAFIQKMKDEGRSTEIQEALQNYKRDYFENVVKIPAQLCYLEGEERNAYLHDMKICQKFAVDNRFAIARALCSEMGWTDSLESDSVFETVHNYIDHESNIVRKGAISAEKGKIVLIPMNMRDGCIIGKGKGNDDWNQSAPHGAGRIMSRSEAFKNIDLEDYRKSMENIYTTSVSKNTIDEAPMAYKDMTQIIKEIEPTVEVLSIIKPIYNFKAAE